MKEIKISQQELFKSFDIAKERIKSAELLLKERLYRDSISRSYYALFEVIRALLATKGVITKTHSGLIKQFGQYYIKTKIIPKKYAARLSELAEERQLADYERLIEFSKVKAEKALKEAKEFVKLAKRIIK
jgi:uncharacterized protein (UPF0332 family)